MASISSEECSDHHCDDRCGSYSLSADVSESESSSSFSFSGLRLNADGASSSMASSPLARRCFDGNGDFPAPVMFPVVGGKDGVVWEDKTEKKPKADLSGNYKYF